MIDTYNALGGSDMNWLQALVIALILIFVVWIVCVSYVQVVRAEISTFSLMVIFARAGVLITITGGIAGWMGGNA